MKKLLVVALLAIVYHSNYAQNNFKRYKDRTVGIEDRINDLLSKMTIEEKILQLNQGTTGYNDNANNIEKQVRESNPAIGSLINFSDDPEFRNKIQKKAVEESRLGIPIIFGYDVIHGFRTVYPISLAQACSWNPELVTKACSIAAKEARLSGIDWTFSPMIDVARDPRWGRVSEGYGEDSYANSVFGVASVKGYQGDKLSDPYSVAACLKHYIGYGMSEGGRDYNYTDVSAQSLWETYMPPYKACVHAGAATLMSAFNDISGVPASANYYTLTQILKKDWQHDGFVVSDWAAVEQLINQGVAKDKKEACLKAFMAGVEMDMTDNIYLDYMKQLIDEGKIHIGLVDESVRRVLRVKFRLGLFENPYTTIVPVKDRVLQSESRQIAKNLALESIVLLKNNKNILPIGKSIRNIAVIGPTANDQDNLLGNWRAHGDSKDAISILQGLENLLKGSIKLNYAKGCEFDGKSDAGFREAINAAMNSDLVILCIGEASGWSGENASRSTIALPNIQEQLALELSKTGKPIIVVLSNGRPLELARIEPIASAMLELWQPGVEGGNAAAEVLTGLVNPSGKLSITFPLYTGQIPIYYCMRQSARPHQGKYQDIPTEPLYWFGHGLSYTSFKYSEIKISKQQFKRHEKVIAEVEVTNAGNVIGKETVLWFIADPACSVSRPMKEFKHFEKKELQPGEKANYTFEIDPLRDLSFVDARGKPILEAGDFFIIVNDTKVKIELID